MQKIKFIIFIIILIILSIFSCKKERATSTTIQEKKVITCKAILVEGNAFVLNESKNEWEQIAAGDLLKENDTLKTESKANVELQFNDNSIVRIKENSELKISKLYSEQNINNTKLFLNSGTLLAKPAKQTEGSNFEVETKSITAGVRGTEFIVIAETQVSKIAVNSGKVIIKKKLKIDSLEKVKEIDVEFAKKIEDAAIGEIELLPNEKIVVSDEEIKNLNNKLTEDVTKILNEIEKSKDSKEELAKTIEKIEKEELNNITVKSAEVLKKENITEKDKKEIPINEFKDMGKESDKNISENTNSTEKIEEKKDDNNIGKQKDKKEKTVVEETNSTKEKELVTVIDKLNNLGVSFSDKNTGITTNGSYIYISSDTNKALFCINSNGKLVWKFTNSKLKKIESFVIPYKNFVVFASYDAIFVLKANNGEIYQSLDITNGTSFWAKPVKISNDVIIPTARYLYKFDGNNISLINEIEASQGQVYIAGEKDSLYISDSLYQNIKEFDFTKNSITWVSDNLVSSSYIDPLISSKYLAIADNDGNLYRFDINSKSKGYKLLKIDSGVTSNLVLANNSLYFVAKNGFLYSADINSFNQVNKIIKVDNNPNLDKYLTKKLILNNDKLYFSSDTGNILSYEIANKTAKFITNEANSEKNPLVGTPVVINKEVYVVDSKSNVYKCYETYK